jgi:hypothetical protein
MAIRDGRRPPFCFQTIGTMAIIRAAAPIKGDREVLARSYAIAAYQALTEIAQTHWSDGGRDGFRAERKLVAETAGISLPTLDRATALFERLGLLQVERETRAGFRLPHRWILIEPVDNRADNAVNPAGNPYQPGDQGLPAGLATPTSRVGNRDSVVEVEELPESRTDDGRARARGLRLVELFGEKTGRQYNPERYLDAILDRLEEHPEISDDEHAAIVTAAFADPWWSEEVPTPQVVWGTPTIFEQRLRQWQPLNGNGRPAAKGRHGTDGRVSKWLQRSEQWRREEQDAAQ